MQKGNFEKQDTNIGDSRFAKYAGWFNETSLNMFGIWLFYQAKDLCVVENTIT